LYPRRFHQWRLVASGYCQGFLLILLLVDLKQIPFRLQFKAKKANLGIEHGINLYLAYFVGCQIIIFLPFLIPGAALPIWQNSVKGVFERFCPWKILLF
jgi:hypothetical protein